MSGKLVVNPVQINDSSTATNNFVLKADNAGGVKLSRGNDGATTQDILTIDAAGKVVMPQGMGAVPATHSMVRVHTANGYGSTNNKIRRFTTVLTNQGSDITYADSATLGASFTINTAGVYAISSLDQSVGAGWTGISLNTTQPTISVVALSVASEMLALGYNTTATGTTPTSWCGYLAAGSVVRSHTGGDATTAGVSTQFTITRVA